MTKSQETSFSAGDGEPRGMRRSLRVMVVDDDPDTVSTLTLLLADEGYEVRGFHTGYEVLDAVADFHPDAIVVDIALPDMDGWEVGRRIRHRFGEVRPLLIAISGRYTKPSDRILAEMSGFNHYFLKPCDPGKLTELLVTLSPAGTGGR